MPAAATKKTSSKFKTHTLFQTPKAHDQMNTQKGPTITMKTTEKAFASSFNRKREREKRKIACWATYEGSLPKPKPEPGRPTTLFYDTFMHYRDRIKISEPRILRSCWERIEKDRKAVGWVLCVNGRNCYFVGETIRKNGMSLTLEKRASRLLQPASQPASHPASCEHRWPALMVWLLVTLTNCIRIEFDFHQAGVSFKVETPVDHLLCCLLMRCFGGISTTVINRLGCSALEQFKTKKNASINLIVRMGL